MADRIIKGDSGNDVVIQNNAGSRKIEITNSGDVEVTGDVKTTTVKATNLKANDGTASLEIEDSTGDIGFSGNTNLKIKLPSAGGIYESDGSTEVITESGGAVTIQNATFNGSIGTSATGSPKIAGFAAYGATQSITAASATYFTGSATAFTNHFNTGTFSNGRFTANVAGFYLVSATAQAPLQDDGENFQLSIVRNQSTTFANYFARQIQYASTTNANMGNSLSSLVFLNGSSDYIELQMYLSGETATVTVHQFSAFLAGVSP